jgi:hypothetical protein
METMLIALALTAGVAAIVAFYSLLARNAPLYEEETSGIPARAGAEIVELPFANADERKAA